MLLLRLWWSQKEVFKASEATTHELSLFFRLMSISQCSNTNGQLYVQRLLTPWSHFLFSLRSGRLLCWPFRGYIQLRGFPRGSASTFVSGSVHSGATVTHGLHERRLRTDVEWAVFLYGCVKAPLCLSIKL